jgi:hypothetical protein
VVVLVVMMVVVVVVVVVVVAAAGAGAGAGVVTRCARAGRFCRRTSRACPPRSTRALTCGPVVAARSQLGLQLIESRLQARLDPLAELLPQISVELGTCP